MIRRTMLASVLAIVALAAPASAQADAAPPSTTTQPSGQKTMLLTIFLRHDQSNAGGDQRPPRPHRVPQGLPAEGVTVVSWYIMMGVGQVVTLELPPEKLRAVNRAIEQTAWGAYRTEFYPTYDFRPIWEEQKKKKAEAERK